MCQWKIVTGLNKSSNSLDTLTSNNPKHITISRTVSKATVTNLTNLQKKPAAITINISVPLLIFTSGDLLDRSWILLTRQFIDQPCYCGLTQSLVDQQTD